MYCCVIVTVNALYRLLRHATESHVRLRALTLVCIDPLYSACFFFFLAAQLRSAVRLGIARLLASTHASLHRAVHADTSGYVYLFYTT